MNGVDAGSYTPDSLINRRICIGLFVLWHMLHETPKAVSPWVVEQRAKWS